MTNLASPNDDDKLARSIVSSRRFAFSCDRVYAAHADAKTLASWWGPAGFTNRVHSFDFRVDGRWTFTMVGPDGAEYENDVRFVVIEPQRLVFEHVDPPHFELTIRLQPEGEHTVVTWNQLFDDKTTRDTVAKFAIDANEQNLDRLQAALSSKVALRA
jgi:uncharacterized protein YndB with AHSA1/START domain